MKKFEVLEHTADIGIEAQGKTRAGAFENAAMGMFSLMVEAGTVAPREERELEVEAEDIEALLVEWLNELLYLVETGESLFCNFDIRELSNTHLRAHIIGEPLDSRKHRIKLQIKACTYHQLKVEKTDDHWTARVIFDI